MAVKWNKIYRGGVQRTTPETREVIYTGSASEILPGTAAALDVDDGITNAIGATDFFYLVGEQMHGSVDDNQVQPEGEGSALRLYSPRSGDLYAGRAAAGLAIVDDLPLTINALGQFAAAAPAAGDDPADPVFAYVDNPASAHPGTETPTVANQLIPIKIK